MANEFMLNSQYGPGGRNCVCCGPSPSNREVHDRSVKRRTRQRVKKEISEMVNE